MLTNNADVAALAVGLVLPAIVAVFTKPSTNPTVKGFAHAVLAVATGSLATYKADPSNFVWAPAVIAAFLAWLSGTTFYHSLLKKYSWFGTLQNLFVSEAESRLNTDQARVIERYFEEAQEAEEAEDAAGITNDFPLSTDTVQPDDEKIVEEVVQAAEVPEVVVTTQTLPQTGGLGPRAL